MREISSWQTALFSHYLKKGFPHGPDVIRGCPRMDDITVAPEIPVQVVVDLLHLSTNPKRTEIRYVGHIGNGASIEQVGERLGGKAGAESGVHPSRTDQG